MKRGNLYYVDESSTSLVKLACHHYYTGLLHSVGRVFVLPLFCNCSSTVLPLFFHRSATVLTLCCHCSATVLLLFCHCSAIVLPFSATVLSLFCHYSTALDPFVCKRFIWGMVRREVLVVEMYERICFNLTDSQIWWRCGQVHNWYNKFYRC